MPDKPETGQRQRPRPSRGLAGAGRPPPYHGLAGEVVARILSRTPRATRPPCCCNTSSSFGNAVGRGPHYQIEQDRHFANLFTVLVGQTSKSRKGTSAGRIRAIFNDRRSRLGARAHARRHVVRRGRDQRGARSGLCHAQGRRGADRRRRQRQAAAAGRARILPGAGRAQARGQHLEPRHPRRLGLLSKYCATITKHSPTRATRPFISIIGHITADELRQALDHTSMANGYANRFLFACVKRSKLLPHGGAARRGDRRQARCPDLGGTHRGTHHRAT